MGLTLGRKLSDILLESLFIVMALLGALAIDEWRDNQAKQQQVEQARHAILQEVKENLSALKNNIDDHQKMAKALSDELDKHNGSLTAADANLDFNYSMVLISSAAWDSARMTQTAQHLPFDEVSGYAKIYNFQSLFTHNQQQLIEMVMQIGGLSDEELTTFTKNFVHRLEMLIDINQMLSKAYRSIDKSQATTDV